MTTSPPEPLHRGANLFQRLSYLVQALEFLVEEALNSRHSQELLISMSESLQSDLDANTSAVGQVQTAITDELAQLAAAIAALSTNASPTQHQLDQLNASTIALQTAAASLTADDPTTTTTTP